MDDFNARMPEVAVAGLGPEGMFLGLFESHANTFVSTHGRIQHIPGGKMLIFRGDTVHCGGFDLDLGQKKPGLMDFEAPPDLEEAEKKQKTPIKGKGKKGRTNKLKKPPTPKPKGMPRFHAYLFKLRSGTDRDKRAFSLTKTQREQAPADPKVKHPSKPYRVGKKKFRDNHWMHAFAGEDPLTMSQEDFNVYLKSVDVDDNDGFVFSIGDELFNKYLGHPYSVDGHNLDFNLALQEDVVLFS
jgi:hypothetical protein